MTVSFTLSNFSSVDSLADPSCPMFTIAPLDLTWGIAGIALALDDCVSAGTVTGWPDGLDPKGLTEDRFDFEAGYKELYEECKAVLDWHTECNPEGDFSEVCFWVRVNFE